MLRKLVGVAVVLCVAGLVTAQKEKDKGSKAPRAKAKVVEVSVKARTLTVHLDGKTQELEVGKDVKFVGPRGGKREMKEVKKGDMVELVMDGKKLKEVHLPVQSRTKDKDREKDKAAPRTKDKDR